ncbi:MAG: S-adenosylmethionine decarboxylase [Proteobacteria bacterium]|nr:S-adenosylmethionine decarboxylase [Pseudomonadota bacterium]
MKDLAPRIFRQRLLIEAYYGVTLERESLEALLNGLAARLALRAYGAPVIFSPGSAASGQNQGFDAFLPLADSGISAYVWSEQRFISVLLYTCKRFEPRDALEHLRTVLKIESEIESAAF